MANGVFAVTVFFICFRECLESVIIVSVLLSFLKQTLGSEGDTGTLKRLNRQVWLGVAGGLFICFCVGGGMIGAFYGLNTDVFTGSEDIWEGAFGFIASIIISIMGAGLLRVSKLQDKWRIKLSQALEEKETGRAGIMQRFKDWSKRHVMFLLPFVTVLREGLEAVVYVGGVGLGLPATSFPLAVVCGLAAGIAVGYLLYRCGNTASLQYFLIISTCFLYLVSAGLFSRAIWYLQNNAWNNIIGGDASETGSGAGSYDIRQSVWHVNCCNPELGSGGGWGIFNALFGWTNSATYGSVLGYNLYWICIIIAYVCMWYNERYGYIPVITACMGRIRPRKAASRSSSEGVVEMSEKRKETDLMPSQIVTREVKGA
ncbi:high-affinity iron transporter FtrA [Aspergillus sclerotioniger CBS 115572]|uniref:High-affinity iron transporter FtrA n=1 Tax=Aspergillus sclerotioniger CBS 115572 TaxID=1450535 RepID=A0A317WV21_9EURO|nr:high-affinity iron transporter FtrA [Aspergillus sclerotioniger CBS 115572]PWY88120.1 high-affinity iron transporter FtrA [Aspergillus sclerotioniger CBS 115572]